MENKKEALERLIKDSENTINILELQSKRQLEIIEHEENILDELKEQLKTEIRKENGTTIPNERWGTHATHCCKRHGCKYGDDRDCPVTLDLVKQVYSCETGSIMGEDCFGEDIDFQMIYDEYKLVLEQIESLTKNSSNGEIYKIHEIVKKALKNKI
jgi:hypothetical protein